MSISLSEAKICHGSAVAVEGRGVLILGKSGAGKSRLALELLALGAHLVADDGVHISVPVETGRVELASPMSIQGFIEARGIGVLRAPVLEFAPLHLVVDLDRVETDRLPPKREIMCSEQRFPLIHGGGIGQLAPAILLYVRYGRDR